ncbi:unnamed protein product [Oppiella nova]|uniref:Uncharacterized protein n=1 Tax=Oppiella nova TaxID=334625 RepID=A0A7R9MDR3_9ACAR|nr:unnamed protein product [Oppiella nova]CAG2175097.1 unnamed protein product [Oppiella nova]
MDEYIINNTMGSYVRAIVEATDIWQSSHLWAPKIHNEVQNFVKMFKKLNAFESNESEISTLIRLAILKHQKRNVYEWHEKYLTQIIPEWESDDIIMDLLTAIILFNPDRPGIVYREVIK